jgi:hypothetical protein
MASTLRLSPDLSLPLDVATEAVAIVARRGRGKTYTASVVAEELAAAGQPFVVLDPTGAWWGLRSSADGRRPGLAVTILGGEHGDVPLEPTAGRVLGNFVAENPGAYVLDLSGFDSNAAQDRFAADFAERLYRAKASDRRPLSLIVDEADSFAPQRPLPGQQRMLGAFEAIVRRGRIRGLGVVLITQRPAVLNKNVLTQAGLLILLGITSPQERAAVDEWVKGHAEPEDREAVLRSLARLDVGEAWVWWPTSDLLVRTRIRKRRTFDSSATPTARVERAPVAFADVDLDALKSAIEQTIEREQRRDPDVLAARIRELERELREARRAVPEQVVERVEVPVVPEVAVASFVGATADLCGTAERLLSFGQDLLAQLERATGASRPAQEPAPARRGRDEPAPDPDGSSASDARSGPLRPASAGPALPLAQRRILTVLAQHPDGRTKRQLALQAGYAASGGGFNNALGALRSAGYIEPSRGEPIGATELGLATLGPVDSLPTGPALLEHWQRQLGRAERLILEALAEAWPKGVDKASLAAAAGYEASGGGFNNALGRLRTLALVSRGPDIRLADELMRDV